MLSKSNHNLTNKITITVDALKNHHLMLKILESFSTEMRTPTKNTWLNVQGKKDTTLREI
jgi:hypothetical protein